MKGRWVDVSLELLGGTTGLQHRPKWRKRRSVGIRRRKLVLGFCNQAELGPLFLHSFFSFFSFLLGLLCTCGKSE